MAKGWIFAWRNLSRNRRRNFTTGLAVAMGFAGMVLLTGYVNRVVQFMGAATVYTGHVGHIGLWKKGGWSGIEAHPKTHSISLAEQKKAAQIFSTLPQVEFFSRHIVGSGLAGNGCKSVPFRAVGVDPFVEERVRSHPVALEWTPNLVGVLRGENLWEATDTDGALWASEGLAKLLGKTKVKSEFKGETPSEALDCLSRPVKGVNGDSNIQLASTRFDGGFAAIDGEMVGVFNTGFSDTNNSSLLMSNEHLQRLFETDTISYFSIYLYDPSEIQRVEKRILQELGDDWEAHRWTDEDYNPTYGGTVAFVISMAGFMFLVVALVILFSVSNAATLAVLERRRELGTLRALGYTPSQVKTLFVHESLLLSGVGLLVGGMLAGVATWAVNASHISFQPPGIAGELQLVLRPPFDWVVAEGLFLVLLTAVSVSVVVHKQCRHKVSELLSVA